MNLGLPYRAGPLVWLANIGATCLVLFLFQKILWLVVPFILALIVYYVLMPLKLYLLLRGVSHDRAAGWVSLLAFGFFLLGTVFGISRMFGDALGWQESAMRYLGGGIRLLTGAISDLEMRFGFIAESQARAMLEVQLGGFFEHFAENYLPGLAMGIVAWSPSLMLAPFLAFFMLRDGWRFRRLLLRAVPNAYFERSLYVMDEVDRTARQYFVGLMQLTLLDTVCLALGLWAIGISGALTLGLVTAVLAWVPYIGSVLGCLLVVLVAATDFPGQPGVAYAAIGLFLFVRLLDDFVFMPLTIGKSLKMHPLLTVLMIFVGGAVAGVPGLMLVLPVLGVIMVVGETLGMLLTDPRLRARHAHERALRQRLVTRDLKLD
jgi:predicted PurR-regulated permease PerM